MNNEVTAPDGQLIHVHSRGVRSDRGGARWFACKDLGCEGWQFADSAEWNIALRPTRLSPQPKPKPEHETPILPTEATRSLRDVLDLFAIWAKLSAADKAEVLDYLNDHAD